ncbi:MAG: hypothetical protein HFF01_09485 [Erysipelotrichaceae bacterium]|nr:hypothetical protein [Erysipelotrichaceae bacterium]
MLVRCKETFGHQITEGNVYLVIEVTIRLFNSSILVRIVDNEGYPAIYDFEQFEIVSNEYINGAILLDEEVCKLSHKDILNSSLNMKHIEGFWGCFIDDDVEAVKILNNVVKELSVYDHIKTPKINS